MYLSAVKADHKIMTIRSILIANRGEIARRVIRTCRRLGIRSIAVYSDPDKDAPFVQDADTAVALGGAQAADSYLNMDKILEAARRCNADAIHPGYGFLSENAEFARRCAQAGFVFVGPNPEAIEAMGSKSRAKRLMQQHQVPVVPGYQGDNQDDAFLMERAREVGFPLLLKAVAGGGGKGMKIVQNETQLESAIQAARREAKNAFGDDTLLIERYFASARHIEFQIFGDKLGNVVHLFERECSLQRRYQKVMEESPSPVLSPELRRTMGEAAINAAKALHYDNAGTVEFILNDKGEFFFLEVNTRLQVEHPVTEEITGLDLVEWQILAAEGQPLPLQQQQIKTCGYAVELRLYAENPNNQFLPETGTILFWDYPSLEGIRYETGIQSGSKVDIYYDPMLAKIIAHAPNRRLAFRRMEYALQQLSCLGIITNREFLLGLMQHPDCIDGKYDTHFIGERFNLEALAQIPTEVQHWSAIAAALYRYQQRKENNNILPELAAGWRNNPYSFQKETFTRQDKNLEVQYLPNSQGIFSVRITETPYTVKIIDTSENRIRLEIDGRQHAFALAQNEHACFVQHRQYAQLALGVKPRLPLPLQHKVKGGYESNMPGEIRHIAAQVGQTVKEGDVLLVLLSMKMENAIVAHADGVVEEIYVQMGETVEAGKLLLKIVDC